MGAFGIIFPSFFGIVFWTLFGKPLFRFLTPKCSIWGPSWGAAGPKWVPKSPKWCPRAVLRAFTRPPREGPDIHLFPGLFWERSWAPFWMIWDGFLMKLHQFWHHFRSTLDAFLMANLQTTKAACHDDIGQAIRGQLPTTPLGAVFLQHVWHAVLFIALILGKCQELPKAAKNQKPTNADNQTQNFNSISTNRCQ